MEFYSLHTPPQIAMALILVYRLTDYPLPHSAAVFFLAMHMKYSVAHDLGSKLRTKDVLLSEGDHTDFKSMLLPQPILDGLTKAGFVQPSPIQLRAIPLARCGFDLIVQSKSGTGKTCVFTVAALDSLNIDSDRLQTLVLAPTREIALQIEFVITAIGSQFSGLKVLTLIGGLPMNDDKVRLKRGCHIIVGTPGRIRHCIQLGLIDLKAVRVFVLDEADMLMQASFQNDINAIFNDLPLSKQVLACSATYTPQLVSFLGHYMQSATHVSPGGQPCPVLLGLRHFALICPDKSSNHLRKLKNKEAQLMSILKSVPFCQCLVFSNYQSRAESVCQLLRRKGWSKCCEWIAGSQDQLTRIDVYKRVRDFEARILLTTDLTARGLDFERANLVINLDIPSDHHTYLHRMGRAGRFGGHGIVITLLANDDVPKFRKLIGKIGSFANAFKIPENLLNKELWTVDLEELDIVEGDFNNDSEDKTAERPQSGSQDEIDTNLKNETCEDMEDEDIEDKHSQLSEFGLKLLRFEKAPEFCSFSTLERSLEDYVSGNAAIEKENCKFRRVLEPTGSLDSDIVEYFLSSYDNKDAMITEMCQRTNFSTAVKWLAGNFVIANKASKELRYLHDTVLVETDTGSYQSDNSESDVQCLSYKIDPSTSPDPISLSSSPTSSPPSSPSHSVIECDYENEIDDIQSSLCPEVKSLQRLRISENTERKPVHIFAPKRKSSDSAAASTSYEHCHEDEVSEQIDGSDICTPHAHSSDWEVVDNTITKRKKKNTGSPQQSNYSQENYYSSNYCNNGDSRPTEEALNRWHALYAKQMSHIRWYAGYSHYMNRMVRPQFSHQHH